MGDDEMTDKPVEFPGPTEESPDPAPPLCPGCQEPMRWIEAASLWQCHQGGPVFVDTDGNETDAPAIECGLCGNHITDHQEGCPLGSPGTAQCAVCGEVMPVTEVADHMNETHGANITRDQIEQSYVQARELHNILRGHHGPLERLRELLTRDRIDIIEIWAAIGYTQTTGGWPEDCGFTPEQALTAAMKEFVSAAAQSNLLLDELRALKTHFGLNPNLSFEAVDLTKMEVPPGFEWNEKESRWSPHCPYGCTDDQPFDCIHRPESGPRG